MRTLKRVVALTVFTAFALGFLMNLTGVPYAAADVGTFCDEGAELNCFTFIPHWDCLTTISRTSCVDGDGPPE